MSAAATATTLGLATAAIIGGAVLFGVGFAIGEQNGTRFEARIQRIRRRVRRRR